jgi:hypothetical protein
MHWRAIPALWRCRFCSSSVMSPCGGPPTASTPTTADRPDQHNLGRLNPSGNKTSTGMSNTSAPRPSITTPQQRELRQGPARACGQQTETTRPSRTTLTRGRCHPARAGRKKRCKPARRTSAGCDSFMLPCWIFSVVVAVRSSTDALISGRIRLDRLQSPVRRSGEALGSIGHPRRYAG